MGYGRDNKFVITVKRRRRGKGEQNKKPARNEEGGEEGRGGLESENMILLKQHLKVRQVKSSPCSSRNM